MRPRWSKKVLPASVYQLSPAINESDTSALHTLCYTRSHRFSNSTLGHSHLWQLRQCVIIEHCGVQVGERGDPRGQRGELVVGQLQGLEAARVQLDLRGGGGEKRG